MTKAYLYIALFHGFSANSYPVKLLGFALGSETRVELVRDLLRARISDFSHGNTHFAQLISRLSVYANSSLAITWITFTELGCP